MAERKVKALVNTVIKLSTDESSSLPDSKKFALAKDSELIIKSVFFAGNNHWEVVLESPVVGVETEKIQQERKP